MTEWNPATVIFATLVLAPIAFGTVCGLLAAIGAIGHTPERT